MTTKKHSASKGWKKILVPIIVGLSATAVKAQTGNPPPLSGANVTNSDRAVLINSNYDGTATSANEFIYLRSGAANRNALISDSWFKKSQMIIADSMVAVFSNTTNGGALKIANRNNELNDRWWLGFNAGDNFSDGKDIARIGVDVRSTSNGSLFFSTGGEAAGGSQLERMRINSLGNVGIGTSTPSVKFEVNGEAKVTKLTTEELMINRNVGIGTSTPSVKLEVNGEAKVTKLTTGDIVASGVTTTDFSSSGTAQVQKLLVGNDLSVNAAAGKQSVIASWNALQLVGNRTTDLNYTSGNIAGLNDASVIIPNQQSDKIGLLVTGKTSQSGNLLELRNSSGSKLSSFSADGRLCINCGTSFTSSNTLLELGQDNTGATAQLVRVHGGATFNNELAPDELTQVSINTNYRIDSAALTVAGPAYIGSWQTAQANPKKEYLKNYMLWVEKGIITEDMSFAPKPDWSDYVFSNEYRLSSLEDLHAYINQYQHLPGVKSATEVASDGYSSHDFNKTILAKVEELTLYIIEQDKKIKVLEQQLAVTNNKN